MTEKKNTLPTQRITTSIETLISRNGLEKTADYLETISISESLRFDEVNINLQKLIFEETVKHFKVNVSLFFSSKNEHYKKARATCFYLYKTYCNLSDRKILLKHKPKFSGTRTRINFAIKSVIELIKMPAIDKKHHALHEKIEQEVKKFIDSSKK